MNRAQRAVIGVAAAVSVGLVLIPPWIGHSQRRNRYLHMVAEPSEWVSEETRFRSWRRHLFSGGPTVYDLWPMDNDPAMLRAGFRVDRSNCEARIDLPVLALQVGMVVGVGLATCWVLASRRPRRAGL